MRLAWLWVVLTACGTPVHTRPAPAPSEIPPPVPEAPEPQPLLGTTGQILLEPLPPLPTARSPLDPRWLDVHADSPGPHYAIAEAFGATSWRDLCAARGRPKGAAAEAMLEYLLAWCDDRGLASTRDALVPLLHGRLADAVHADLADLLAAEPVSTACAWLATRRIDTREGLHDALVATYLALGRTDDAARMLQYLDRTDHAEAGTRCMRLARERPLVDAERRAQIDTMREQTALHSTDPACHVPPTCLSWAQVTSCDGACSVQAIQKEWLACRVAAHPHSGTDFDDIVRRHWPVDRSAYGWRLLAATLVGAASDEIALAALTNAVRLSTCSADEVADLAVDAQRLWDRGGPAREPQYADLQNLTEERCRAFPRPRD